MCCRSVRCGNSIEQRFFLMQAKQAKVQLQEQERNWDDIFRSHAAEAVALEAVKHSLEEQHRLQVEHSHGLEAAVAELTQQLEATQHVRYVF
jgi:hypothetical protein